MRVTERLEAERELNEGQLIVPDGYAEGGDTGSPRAARRMVIVRPKKQAKVRFVTPETRIVRGTDGWPCFEGDEEAHEVVREKVELLGSLAVHVGAEYNDLFDIQFQCPLCEHRMVFRDFYCQRCNCGKVYCVPRDLHVAIEVNPARQAFG